MTPHRTAKHIGSKPSAIRRTIGAAAIIGALMFVGFSPSAFAADEVPEAGPIGEGPATEPPPVEVVDLIGDPLMPSVGAGVSQASPQLAVPSVEAAAPAPAGLPATGMSHLVIEAMVAGGLVGLGLMARRTANA